MRLYEHLLEVTEVSAVSKMNRYNKLKAALRMLTLNAARFRPHMLKDDGATKLFNSECSCERCVLWSALVVPAFSLPATMLRCACTWSSAHACCHRAQG